VPEDAAAAPPLAERPFAGKHHLVPFGEYVPAWIPFLHTLVPEIADFRPASDDGVVRAAGIAYGALICYESLFPEEARARVLAGAGVLVNVTNDAWYGTMPAAWQHFQAARMRAVETGRYVLRAANTGVTAIIRPDGSLAASIPWWRQQALVGRYQVSARQTGYVRLGDWPLLVCLLMFMIPLFRRQRPNERRRNESRSMSADI
jgi:apolipoprotein N-acyltransferase